MAWIRHLPQHELDRAVAAAPPDAPAVVPHRTGAPASPSATVASCLEAMETVASQLFPAWLPGAEGITTAAGAAPAAVRALAVTHAAATAQYGPFLADLAAGALAGPGAHTRRHPPEVRALGLTRVLATGLGRPACALLLRPPGNLDEHGASALDAAARWLRDHGRLAVWICGGATPAAAHPLDIGTARPARAAPAADDVPEASRAPRRGAPVTRRPPRKLKPGQPHPTSRAELVLEAALAGRPWAAGRLWNHTVRPGPLVNPVRVDLLWRRERCIVEIDGDDHRTAGKYADDRNRDVMLQLSGYAVLRFTNSQVLHDLESILALLQQFLASRRPPGKGN